MDLFAYALHRYGICFALNEIYSFANELSTRHIEKGLRMKHEKFVSKNKKKCQKEKNLWDSNSGILTLKLSTE